MSSNRKNNILFVEIWKESRQKSNRFRCFEDANAYLASKVERMAPFSTISYSIYILWAGNLEFRGFIELSARTFSRKAFLESYVQSVMESEILLLPAGGDITDLLHKCFHIRRIVLNDMATQKMKSILFSCEGMDTERYLARKKDSERKLAAFAVDYPLVERVVQDGKELMRGIHSIRNRSGFFRNVFLARQNFPLSHAIGYAFSKDTKQTEAFLASAKDIYAHCMSDISVMDERFTSFGMELYRLTSVDVQRLRSIQYSYGESERAMQDSDAVSYIERNRNMYFRDAQGAFNKAEEIFLRSYRHLFRQRGAFSRDRSAGNRTDITLRAAKQVQRSLKSADDVQVLQVIERLDPLAVHQPSYAEGILSYLNSFSV